MSFISTLPWWAWLFFALIPPAIIALYFLKLRLAPLVVPSTYLWIRPIEDLHVNSLWQRLQNNVLLYLQLLVVALLFLALLRPGCRSESQLGQRSILLIDHSASMSATDEGPNRLTVAKQKALKLVDEGLEWLQENPSASAEEFKEKMKEYEGKIRPFLMKLYAGSGPDGAEGMMPGMMGQPSQEPAAGPRVEEVD